MKKFVLIMFMLLVAIGLQAQDTTTIAFSGCLDSVKSYQDYKTDTNYTYLFENNTLIITGYDFSFLNSTPQYTVTKLGTNITVSMPIISYAAINAASCIKRFEIRVPNCTEGNNYQVQIQKGSDVYSISVSKQVITPVVGHWCDSASKYVPFSFTTNTFNYSVYKTETSLYPLSETPQVNPIYVISQLSIKDSLTSIPIHLINSSNIITPPEYSGNNFVVSSDSITKSNDTASAWIQPTSISNTMTYKFLSASSQKLDSTINYVKLTVFNPIKIKSIASDYTNAYVTIYADSVVDGNHVPNTNTILFQNHWNQVECFQAPCSGPDLTIIKESILDGNVTGKQYWISSQSGSLKTNQVPFNLYDSLITTSTDNSISLFPCNAKVGTINFTRLINSSRTELIDVKNCNCIMPADLVVTSDRFNNQACKGQTVTFTSNKQANDTTFSFTWNSGMLYDLGTIGMTSTMVYGQIRPSKITGQDTITLNDQTPLAQSYQLSVNPINCPDSYYTKTINFSFSTSTDTMPAPPIVKDVTFNYASSNAKVTAIGNKLKWYTDLPSVNSWESPVIQDTLSVNTIISSIRYVTQTNGTCESEPAKMQIIIQHQNPDSIVLSPLSKSLTVGDSILLWATVYPLNALQSVYWISSNPEVATVNNTTGIVTAVSNGTTIITARTNADSTISATDSIQVQSLTIPKTYSVFDIDGNGYDTVRIGTQTWFQENLKVTKYNDGSIIPNSPNSVTWAALTTGAQCTYNNTTNADTINTFGRLYNWYAGSTAKLCPTGWHVPNNTEWITLEYYLRSNGYGYLPNSNLDDSNYVAKSMASSTGWAPYPTNGTIGNNPIANNKSGFTALPGGNREYNGTFNLIGSWGGWWSSDGLYDSFGDYWDLYYNNSNLGYYSGTSKTDGHSVRCLKDNTDTVKKVVCSNVIALLPQDTIVVPKYKLSVVLNAPLQAKMYWKNSSGSIVDTASSYTFNLGQKDTTYIIEAYNIVLGCPSTEIVEYPIKVNSYVPLINTIDTTISLNLGDSIDVSFFDNASNPMVWSIDSESNKQSIDTVHTYNLPLPNTYNSPINVFTLKMVKVGVDTLVWSTKYIAIDSLHALGLIETKRIIVHIADTVKPPIVCSNLISLIIKDTIILPLYKQSIVLDGIQIAGVAQETNWTYFSGQIIGVDTTYTFTPKQLVTNQKDTIYTLYANNVVPGCPSTRVIGYPIKVTDYLPPFLGDTTINMNVSDSLDMSVFTFSDAGPAPVTMQFAGKSNKNSIDAVENRTFIWQQNPSGLVMGVSYSIYTIKALKEGIDTLVWNSYLTNDSTKKVIGSSHIIVHIGTHAPIDTCPKIVMIPLNDMQICSMPLTTAYYDNRSLHYIDPTNSIITTMPVDTLFPKSQDGNYTIGKHEVSMTVVFDNGCSVVVHDSINIIQKESPTISNVKNFYYEPNDTKRLTLDTTYTKNIIVYWYCPSFGKLLFTGNGAVLDNSFFTTVGDYSFTVKALDTITGCTSAEIGLTVHIMDPSLPSIKGTVLGNNTAFNDGIVQLFKPKGSSYTAVSTQVINADGSFNFKWLEASDYLIRALPNDLQSAYLPSYYVNAIDWQDANVISLKGKIQGLHLSLVDCPLLTSGGGSITGSVDVLDSNFASPLKSFSPIKMSVLVVQNGQVIAYACTDVNGNYKVDNLPDGTYDIYVEAPGYAKFAQTVSINNGSSTSADFSLKDGIASTTGVTVINSSNTAVLYPNPTSDNITIQSNSSVQSVDIMNIAGVNVLKRNSCTSINVSQLPVGMYIVKIITNKETIIKTFIKQ